MTPRAAEKKKRPPRLDPIFPLPADTGMLPVRQGDGKDILSSTAPTKFVELSYRAFWLVWEHIEKEGARQYERYKDGGPLDNIAKAYLEAVHAFRNSYWDRVLPVMSEDRAKKARAILAQIEEAEASAKKKTKSKSPGEPTESTESPAKRDQCSSLYRGVNMELLRCSGPAGHKRKKHKGRTKTKVVVEWTDEEADA